MEAFLVLDVRDDGLRYLQEYEPVTDPSATIEPFAEMNPSAIVKISEVMGCMK